MKKTALRLVSGASALMLLPAVALAQTTPAETDHLAAVQDKAEAMSAASLPTLVAIAVVFIGIGIAISLVLKARRVTK